jgi:plasmid stability protein
MSTMVQIRNVPDSVHRKLRARAAMEGMSLSEFLLREIRRVSEVPTRTELLERIAGRSPVETKGRVVAMLRAERDGR